MDRRPAGEFYGEPIQFVAAKGKKIEVNVHFEDPNVVAHVSLYDDQGNRLNHARGQGRVFFPYDNPAKDGWYQIRVGLEITGQGKRSRYWAEVDYEGPKRDRGRPSRTSCSEPAQSVPERHDRQSQREPSPRGDGSCRVGPWSTWGSPGVHLESPQLKAPSRASSSSPRSLARSLARPLDAPRALSIDAPSRAQPISRRSLAVLLRAPATPLNSQQPAKPRAAPRSPPADLGSSTP